VTSPRAGPATEAPSTIPVPPLTIRPSRQPTTIVTDPPIGTTAQTDSTEPPAPGEGSLGLEFSIDQTFTEDLLNSTSAGFRTLANNVTSEVNRAYRNSFPGTFSRSLVNSFSAGSVVVDMTLVFNNKSVVPTTSNAVNALQEALNSLSSFLNIIPGTLNASVTDTIITTVQPTATTSGSPKQTINRTILMCFSLLYFLITRH
ncbi:hypothetical protein AAFF_G00357770, partial [Aldrovandia affinis]